MCHFGKFYGNKLVFIIYTRLKQNPIGVKVNDNNNQKSYNDPLMNFKLLQLQVVMLILSVSKNVLIHLRPSMC